MSTIRSPRKRARVRSFRFQALWWLIAREAAARVIWPGFQLARPGYSAFWLVSVRTDTLRRTVERTLWKFPSRQVCP